MNGAFLKTTVLIALARARGFVIGDPAVPGRVRRGQAPPAHARSFLGRITPAEVAAMLAEDAADPATAELIPPEPGSHSCASKPEGARA